MKKLTALILCMAAAAGFSSCGSRPVMNQVPNTPDHQQQTEASDQDGSGADSASGADTKSPEMGQQGKSDEFSDSVPVVYMTEKITPKSIKKLYQALGKEIEGEHTAVKVSFENLVKHTAEDSAEKAAGQGVAPALIQELVQDVDGTIVECRTVYGESFAEADLLYQTAEDLGFTEIADVDVMDEDGAVVIPAAGGKHLTENYVGAGFTEYDGFLVFSHFQSHAAAGFDGAVRNISMGISSAKGKCLIHTAGSSQESLEIGNQDAFLESMAEAGKSVVDAMDGNLLFLNIIDRFSTGCDCGNDAEEPDIHDIGILASADPVALDQACADLIYMEEGCDDFIDCMEECNAEYALEYGEEIGLGNCAYTIVSVDR